MGVCIQMQWLSTVVRAALAALLALSVLSTAASAQNAPDPRLKEVQVASKSFLIGEPVPGWVEPVPIPATAEKQPVVTRLADTQYLVDRTPSVFVRRATAINDAASLTKAGQVLISFVPDYHLVRLHWVRVLRGGETLDRTTSASIRFFQRETGLEQGIYSGEVTAALLVSDLRVGDTLEIAYTLEGQNPIFGSKTINFTALDLSIPSVQRRIAVLSPVGRPIAWKVVGGRPSASAPKPTESVSDGMRRLVFEERSLSAVQPDPHTPPEHSPYRYIQLSEFGSWEEVVAWAEGLFQVPDAPIDDELRGIVEKLRGMATDEERVVAALEFVQAEIRYFSVSLGESSHRPAPPGVVLKRRYGDCKDKSLLLIALLRALGIESHAVLVAVGQPRGLDKALPSPQLFNHVIVQVKLDGQLYYLDPTRLGQHGPLGRMGQVHAYAQVLPIAPGVRRLVTIAEPDDRELRSEVAESATLSSFTADAELQVRQTWRGAAAEQARIAYQHVPREQMRKSFDGVIEQRYPGAKAVAEPEVVDDRKQNTFTVSTFYSVPKIAVEQGGSWFVRYAPTNLKATLPPAPPTTRRSPLLLSSFPYRAAYSFEIKLPPSVSVVSDPRTTTVKGKHFKYTQSMHFRGNLAKSTIELRVTADQVAPEDLVKYGEDLRAIGAARAGVIVIPKAAIKTTRAARKSFATLLKERVEDTVAKTTQAIKSGKLGGSDLASAYCLRASAHADLGSIKKALADAGEALKLAPQSPDALHCMGYAHFAAGDFDKSIAHYSKGLTLGGHDGTFQQRGVARFYAGQLEAAAEDFAKAASLSAKETQTFSDLWLAWTLQRLGRPLPDDLVKRAAEQPRGAWPRPALAVFAGHLEPAELIRLIERKTGDEGKMAAAEGHFYIGQYFLGLGEVDKARAHFQKARKMNVLIYIEHKAAEFELRKLPAPTEAVASGDAAPPPTKARKSSTKRKAKRPAPETDWKSGIFAR
jgi:lipoprotein NlpI/transglutaminase-like putative cysteine protease